MMNRNIKAIYHKELKSYFTSPVAYIVISIFLILIGWLFFSTFFLEKQANLIKFFNLLPITLAFIIPAVTMRLFSEEINVGSYELLMTLPVSFRDIIVGKFLSVIIFICLMLSPTLVYAFTVSLFGSLDWGPVLGGYLGVLLLGSAFGAIGLFASSLTKNQVVAFIISMSICFVITVLLDFVLFFVPDFLVGIFQYLSANFHFKNIAKGIIDTRDVVYFLSMIFVFLYGTNLIMQEKK